VAYLFLRSRIDPEEAGVLLFEKDLDVFPSFGSVFVEPPNAKTDRNEKGTQHEIRCGPQKFIHEITDI
jgi:hypothetical protein